MRGIIASVFCIMEPISADTRAERGEDAVKKEEKEPIAWEVKDPKPPVVQSGHMEDRKQR